MTERGDPQSEAQTYPPVEHCGGRWDCRYCGHCGACLRAPDPLNEIEATLRGRVEIERGIWEQRRNRANNPGLPKPQAMERAERQLEAFRALRGSR